MSDAADPLAFSSSDKGDRLRIYCLQQVALYTTEKSELAQFVMPVSGSYPNGFQGMCCHIELFAYPLQQLMLFPAGNQALRREQDPFPGY